MDEIINRLEAATEGSQELDCEIGMALGWTVERPYEHVERWANPDGSVLYRSFPWSYTTSLDAALTLIPARTEHTKERSYQIDAIGFERCYAAAYRDGDWFHGISRTPALALVIAALRARAKANQEGKVTR